METLAIAQVLELYREANIREEDVKLGLLHPVTPPEEGWPGPKKRLL